MTHISTNRALSRRSILKGSGIAIALPFLDAMSPVFGKSVKYIEISQKICGNECGSWVSWSQPFSGEGGE